MLIVCIEDLDRIDDIQTTELSQQKIFCLGLLFSSAPCALCSLVVCAPNCLSFFSRHGSVGFSSGPGYPGRPSRPARRCSGAGSFGSRGRLCGGLWRGSWCR